MQEIVRRHFWKVTIIILVILAALWFAPRVQPPSPPPSLPPQPSSPEVPSVTTDEHRKSASQQDSPGNILLALADPQSAASPSSSLQATRSERGKASFYGGYFHGRRTASGEIYNQNSFTAAHRTLRMGTMVIVKNLRNGREVTVRINNRGPYARGRIIDVSTRAARELRMVDSGVVPVEISVLERPETLAQN
jgi:rare lipoprotein A